MKKSYSEMPESLKGNYEGRNNLEIKLPDALQTLRL